MKPEQIIFPVMRAAAKRDWSSRLGNLVLKPWNPFEPKRYINPYPLYDRARSAGRVTYQKSLRSWNVMGYAEAEEALRSAHVSVDRSAIMSYLPPYHKLQPATLELFMSTMLMKDPARPYATPQARESSVHTPCRGRA